ncbi:MAG TPA: hypothetical protein VNR18_08010 [Hyphomicrobiales bacterium]|nr:hypothetical protein [Hyphomicrobiales bacterium]
MTQSPKPLHDKTGKPDAAKPPKTENEPPPGDQDMTKTVKEKVEQGELSANEARKLFEDVGKQLDA